MNLNQTGYAVMSPDLSGISFEHEDFDRCKQNCFNGDVIVKTWPKKCGFNLRVRFHPEESWFKWDRYGNHVLFKLRFNISPEYRTIYGEEVLYTNPYNYSESVKKGVIER